MYNFYMTKQFFYLLKSGLELDNNETPKWFPLSINEWQGIWSMAKKQTVCGFVFAGIEKLPIEMQPPRELMLQFWGYTENIKKNNLKVYSVAKEIVDWFYSEKLEPIIIKGISVGALYSRPELRMPGDIDIFFHRNYDKAFSIIKDKNIETIPDYNHDMFFYKGITVELHHKAFTTLHPVDNIDFFPILFENDAYKGLVLNLKANAMLMLMHPAKHFMAEGIGLRQLCDWAMFLKRYENYPELDEAWKEVKRQGAERFAIEFTAVAVHYMHLKLSNPEKWIGKSKLKLRKRMLRLILMRGNFGKIHKSKRSINAFIYFYELGKYILYVLPYWKLYFWKSVPKRILYRLLYILKGNPMAIRYYIKKNPK